MNLPKQSAPISRDAIPGKNFNQRGVTASILRTEFNQVFGRRGTCSCQTEFNVLGNTITVATNNCKRGFSPKCNGGLCRCE